VIQNADFVHYILFAEKLLNSSGREFRRALFSLKQIFQVFMYHVCALNCSNLYHVK